MNDLQFILDIFSSYDSVEPNKRHYLEAILREMIAEIPIIHFSKDKMDEWKKKLEDLKDPNVYPKDIPTNCMYPDYF